MARNPTTDTSPSFQTARLTRGEHISAEHGVCAMELASMLAGERFGDHPRSVSPVLAAFLRTYNDLVDDDRRQDLFKYAADCVGTRSSTELECIRTAALPPAVETSLRARLARRFSLPSRRRAARAASAASDFARTPWRHSEALELVDRLIALGTPAPAEFESRRLPSRAPIAPRVG